MMSPTRWIPIILWFRFDLITSLSLPTRREAMIAAGSTVTLLPALDVHAETDLPDSLDVANYMRTGFVSNPMGVSGQAGKSRPETGVYLRDGSEVFRDTRKGDVSAEIVMLSREGSKVPVLVSYASPWPLAKGTVYDVECRDAKTGDGAFLAVSPKTSASSVAQVADSFLVDELFKSTGRFSFYGQPTDVKIRSSSITGDYKTLEATFATLSQSTQTELPRRALITATIPAGTEQVVMLVASASNSRWKKVQEEAVKVGDSFRAIPAPQTSMKVRTKARRS